MCLYVGEVIHAEEAERRGKIYDREGCTYLFDLDFNETENEDCLYSVDAAKYGNIAHFINHSCDPNVCKRRLKNSDGTENGWHGIFADKDIKEGEELTISYINKDSLALGREQRWQKLHWMQYGCFCTKCKG